MPSSSEGMPVAAIEALAHGLAIAASDIPGVRDVVTDETNGVVTPLEKTAFANAIRQLCEDSDRLARFRRASWEKATEFDLGAIIAHYEGVLANAAHPRP